MDINQPQDPTQPTNENDLPSAGSVDSTIIDLGDIKDPTEVQGKLEEMVTKLIGDEFNPWASWRTSYETVWDEIYSLYMGKSNLSKMPTRAKLFVPIIFQVIEAAVPKVINTLFNGEEFFDVVPTVASDAPIGQSIKKLLVYQLGQSDVFIKFVDFSKQLLLYGTSYLFVFWKVRRQWCWSRTPVRQDVSFFGFKLGNRITEWEDTKEYKVVEKRPEMDVLDILDVFPDPDARNDKAGYNGKGIWIRSFIDIDELKELASGPYPVYTNVDEQKIKGDSQTFIESRRNRFSARNTSASPSKNQVELLTRWGLYDLDGDGIREESQIVIANRRVVIRAKANPFHHQKRPVLRCPCFPVPGEWYGIGLVEPVVGLQHEINTLRRQRIDNINIIINRMWKVNSTADVELDTLISSPNGIVITDDMAAVEAIETQEVTGSNMQESQQAMQDIENTTISKAAQGTQTSGALGRTASGAKLLVSQALDKFVLIVRLIEEFALKRTLRMYHQLNIQMIDDDQTLRDPGMYGHLFDEKITADMLKADVGFRMVGISEMVGKEARINQAVSYMGVFANFLDGASISYFAKEVGDLMGFDPEEIQLQGQANPQGNPAPAGPIPPQAAQAIAGQAGKNGLSSAPSIPGVKLPGGQ